MLFLFGFFSQSFINYQKNIKKNMKKTLQKIINFFGYNIKKKDIFSRSKLLIEKMESLSINLVFDIGANIGQSAIGLIESGYKGKIISFEPLENEYNKLINNSKKYDNWIVADRTAIGSENDITYINVAGNSGSSSILPMNETHSNAEPVSKYIGKQEVKICKLDTISVQYINNTSVIMLKIDTQGFESQVLDGAIEIMSKIKCITLELSLFELYKGQTLWKELIERLEKLGFKLWSIEPGFFDPKDGQMLQIDATFFRN